MRWWGSSWEPSWGWQEPITHQPIGNVKQCIEYNILVMRGVAAGSQLEVGRNLQHTSLKGLSSKDRIYYG